MQIHDLSLRNFRNYESRAFNFDSRVNIIIGPNGIGKTNILEAIYVLTHGRSWRTRYDLELIKFDEQVANIKAQINSSELFIGLERTQTRRTKKIFKFNGVTRSMTKFTQHAKSVIFSPQDLDIIIGSPSNRRQFLDEVIEQVDFDYKVKSSELKKIVRNRNKILERINEGFSRYSEIEYWNTSLIKNSSYIHAKRKELIEYINNFLSERFSIISNSNAKSKVEYLHSVATKERLEKYKQGEISSKRTLIGAHKDDLLIELSKFEYAREQTMSYLDARYYASRGEQRALVFTLKLASLSYIQEKLGTGIILLLDDIYSELDENHRNAISEYFNSNQVIITTAEKSLVPKSLLDTSKLLLLS